ncbi:MAG: glycolate oxidase subunit GlcE [Candidatus Thiodiazotropha sp. (ex Myrtea spinifera)]|nr:glycolate oxidase subunit GlcE [Candidatus Thiodiazotropha sp. (ex Myrtea spinifera)]
MNGDQSKLLQEQVISAAAEQQTLDIQAGNTKRFLGRSPQGEPLDLSTHQGILSYEPKELVITARSGTPLHEIEAALAEKGQMLPFDPPHFGAHATLGGTIATGLSGPRRPYTGSARDFVLGTRVLNGRGEILRFGGEVMKNVAGYDVSRLMTGAMGTLGVILDISLKVLPIPAGEITLAITSSSENALKQFNAWSGKPIPLSAAVCDGERAYIRLSGATTSVEAARHAIGGEMIDDSNAFWRKKMLEHQHAFFQGSGDLWRISVPSSTPSDSFPDKCLIDWGGALRWIRTDLQPQAVFQTAGELGGHATLFRGGDRQGQVFQPLPKTTMDLHQRLKLAFDPQRIFNPGRMYAEL